MSPAKTDELIKMPFVGGRSYGLNKFSSEISRWGAHWRHLANTVERSVARRCDLVSNYFDRLFKQTLSRTAVLPIVTTPLYCECVDSVLARLCSFVRK